MAPTTTIKFQDCSFQLNLKKVENLSAPKIVHMVLKFEDMPNVFPKYNNSAITNAISGPDTYQGQGFNIKFIPDCLMQM